MPRPISDRWIRAPATAGWDRLVRRGHLAGWPRGGCRHVRFREHRARLDRMGRAQVPSIALNCSSKNRILVTVRFSRGLRKRAECHPPPPARRPTLVARKLLGPPIGALHRPTDFPDGSAREPVAGELATFLVDRRSHLSRRATLQRYINPVCWTLRQLT